MDTSAPLSDSTHRLISSLKIEGTPVIDNTGESVGTVHSIMLDKQTGQAEQVVIGTSWFLGATSAVIVLDWNEMRYVPDRHGYMTEMSRKELEQRPRMRLDEGDRPTPI